MATTYNKGTGIEAGCFETIELTDDELITETNKLIEIRNDKILLELLNQKEEIERKISQRWLWLHEENNLQKRTPIIDKNLRIVYK